MDTENENLALRQVLFVDDEPDFLQMVQEALAPLSAGVWIVHTATSADTALEILSQHQLDLVVVDVNMPVLDGIQFLNVLTRRNPTLKKVILTGHATEEKRSQSLANGAELFIEKPSSAEGMKSVFAMLDDLMNWAPQQGFQGAQRRVGLQDVIQMECLGRNSSVLEIYNEHVLGRIYIEDGQLTHAAGGDLTGERALEKLLALPGGSFELVPFEPPPQRTLTAPWDMLLAEVTRARLAAAAGQNFGAPAINAETLTLATNETSAQVVETLICNGNGEPLYDFGCPDAHARMTFLLTVANQAALLTQILPLGDFDRLEMQLPAGRAVGQANTDRLIFVRATLGQPAVA